MSTTIPTAQRSDARGEAQLALGRARELLLSLQHERGWWKGELQTNVTMDAEDMLLREFLDIRQADESERSAAWIRSQQRADGTWANFHDGPGDLSTTIEAYWALKLAGDDPQAEHMQAAASFVRAQGGVQRARVFTHVWLALFGLWSWDEVPALPPEIVLLPSWVPLNIYDFACWARQTVVALSIVMAHRPQRQLGFDLQELSGAQPWRAGRPRTWRGRVLLALDRLARAYSHHPIRPLRRLALARAERWIVRRQEADGSWGGIQPPWVYSLMALQLCGYAIDHPVMARGVEGLDRFMVEEQGGDPRGVGAPPCPSRRLEACQSPVWDTALAIVALADAGVPGDDPALIRAARWLLDEEIGVPGDWAVRRPGLAPGGWAFEFANDNYPDVDDTAEVAIALTKVKLPLDSHERARSAVLRAVRWVSGMRSRHSNDWGAFDADNTRRLVREIPFLDFGEVIDEPSADVTAHVVEMLALLDLADTPIAQEGARRLLEMQHHDGSWFGRWGVNHVYGTGAALPALIAAGAIEPSHPAVRRAVRWLEDHQNEDGGWGEDCRSYEDPAWIGRGPSTASQTAWALLALHAAECGHVPGLGAAAAGGSVRSASPALRRGVRWLVEHQREDGGWDEPQHTGTGFPGHFYINYHLYRLTFPLMALGRCLRDFHV